MASTAQRTPPRSGEPYHVDRGGPSRIRRAGQCRFAQQHVARLVDAGGQPVRPAAVRMGGAHQPVMGGADSASWPPDAARGPDRPPLASCRSAVAAAAASEPPRWPLLLLSGQSRRGRRASAARSAGRTWRARPARCPAAGQDQQQRQLMPPSAAIQANSDLIVVTDARSKARRPPKNRNSDQAAKDEPEHALSRRLPSREAALGGGGAICASSTANALRLTMPRAVRSGPGRGSASTCPSNIGPTGSASARPSAA